MEQRPLLVVDAPSLYFRAYFGVPDSVRAPDGRPVNAIRGFLDFLATLVTMRGPGRLVCALDFDWRPAWRVALLPSYKRHRVAPGDSTGRVEVVPRDLERQIPILLEMLAAFGIPAVGAEGYEADDVVGVLAHREPAPVEVASGDRDLFQLVDDAKPVRVLYCGRGVAKLAVTDDAAVRAGYGVPAASYVDFAVLRGDPSDGLPGVAGIGAKTAAVLLTRYGSLDALVAAIDDRADKGLAPGVRAKLAAARDYLAVAPTVVRTALDAPVPVVDTTLPRVPADPDRLVELAERHNLAGPARRLTDTLAKNSG